MKRFLVGFLAAFMFAGTVLAEDVNREEAYTACSQYIENKVSYFRGTFVPRGHKIKVVPKYTYKDLGKSHWLTWTLKNRDPIYLAKDSEIIKGLEGMSGAGCEVDKKSGEIKYLSVSDKEIIRP